LKMRCFQAIFGWGESLGEVLDRRRRLDRAQEVKSPLHGGFGFLEPNFPPTMVSLRQVARSGYETKSSLLVFVFVLTRLDLVLT
jgi:hypothetical protein